MRAALRGRAPDRSCERACWTEGHRLVVGVDEVGRGAWAGPLTVGAVVANRDRRITGVRDSKMLTEAEREALIDRITGWAEAWSVGHASNDECDALGMSEAQRLAARRALDGLGVLPDRVLLDGSWDFVGGGSAGTEPAEGSLSAPMPGTVLEVHVKEGQRVRKGQTLVVLEAMKMEHRIQAPKAGEVTKLHFSEGDRVDMGEILVQIGD